MKKSFKLLTLIVFAFFLQNCDPYDSDNYSEYEPILMNRPQMERSISYTQPQQLQTPGKIYFKDDFILIGEKYKGIHVIDNSVPSMPVNIGFINVPGCVDMAMRYNALYVDNAVDLVTIDLSEGIENLEITSRIQSVFPEHTPPDGKPLNPLFNQANRPVGTIITGWKKNN